MFFRLPLSISQDLPHSKPQIRTVRQLRGQQQRALQRLE
jgi:hypothetical protein